ncbi:mechanosensitive ion channel family protein [Hydrogenimonas urashimensis]|uniref:mechanosensitive ion channel family protein n=1 Tax=Hydrogenimonas urashimensis TaxID=2740515 RepID=UPI0019168940|nr:mechanosensitive ion channel family protein [Hydrogenimonas urashimensis]
MKRAGLFLLLALSLFAAKGFWQTLIEVEKTFYATEPSIALPLSTKPSQSPETNVTQPKSPAGMQSAQAVPAKKAPVQSGKKPSPDLSHLADEKIAKFNLLLTIMKERPYEVDNPHNDFYNPATSEQQRSKLRTRIAVNRQYGYDLAVIRDEIGLVELQIRRNIYNFFVTLAENWTDMSQKEMLDFFKQYAKTLQSVDTARFTKAFIAAKKADDPISGKIVENYKKLRMHYLFFSEFLEYLSTNPSMLRYRSIMSLFRLDEIIDRINTIEAFAKANTHLRHIHTDMGRLLIFIFIMILAWGSSYLFYYKLYAFLKREIQKEYHETDELLLSNLEGMRRPFFILVLAFGFRLGLEVLFHPAPIPEKLAIFFYAILLGTIAYIIIIIIDSLFFDYMVKKGELRNKELRQELINLILSIIKALIVIIAVSMLLVRMGVNITGLVASLGIGGLAVALAAQNTLSNFFGLLKIIFDNSFSQGDWIETSDVEGTVVEIGFISTMIRTFDNAMITVPNAVLANSPLKNWSKRSVGRRIKMHVGVTYGADRQRLMAAIKEIETMLREHPGIASPQKVDRQMISRRSKRSRKLLSMEDKYGIKTTLLVYLDEFDDYSINILIYCFSKSVVWQEWLEVKQDVLLKIWEILDRHGLDFAFPSESVYFDPENIGESFKKAAENTKLLSAGK